MLGTCECCGAEMVRMNSFRLATFTHPKYGFPPFTAKIRGRYDDGAYTLLDTTGNLDLKFVGGSLVALVSSLPGSDERFAERFDTVNSLGFHWNLVDDYVNSDYKLNLNVRAVWNSGWQVPWGYGYERYRVGDICLVGTTKYRLIDTYGLSIGDNPAMNSRWQAYETLDAEDMTYAFGRLTVLKFMPGDLVLRNENQSPPRYTAYECIASIDLTGQPDGTGDPKTDTEHWKSYACARHVFLKRDDVGAYAWPGISQHQVPTTRYQTITERTSVYLDDQLIGSHYQSYDRSITTGRLNKSVGFEYPIQVVLPNVDPLPAPDRPFLPAEADLGAATADDYNYGRLKDVWTHQESFLAFKFTGLINVNSHYPNYPFSDTLTRNDFTRFEYPLVVGVTPDCTGLNHTNYNHIHGELVGPSVVTGDIGIPYLDYHFLDFITPYFNPNVSVIGYECGPSFVRTTFKVRCLWHSIKTRSFTCRARAVVDVPGHWGWVWIIQDGVYIRQEWQYTPATYKWTDPVITVAVSAETSEVFYKDIVVVQEIEISNPVDDAYFVNLCKSFLSEIPLPGEITPDQYASHCEGTSAGGMLDSHGRLLIDSGVILQPTSESIGYSNFIYYGFRPYLNYGNAVFEDVNSRITWTGDSFLENMGFFGRIEYRLANYGAAYIAETMNPADANWVQNRFIVPLNGIAFTWDCTAPDVRRMRVRYE